MFYTDIQNIFRNSPDKNSPINQIKFFSETSSAFFSPVVKQINSLVYNIKCTYLLAFCSPVGTHSPRTLYVQC